MSFTVAPKNAASIQTPPGSSARDRAIAKLTASQETLVSNPTKVSPEEMSAIMPPKAASEGQSTPSVETSAESPSQPPKQVTEKAKEAGSEEEPQLSQQYATLARKEKSLRQKIQGQEAAFKAREEALAAREAALVAKDSEYQSKYIPKDRLAEDPLTVLQEAGLSYDQLTQMLLSPPTQQDPAIKAAINELKAELKATKEAQEQAKKAAQDASKASYDQAVNQIRTEAKQLVTNDPAFEMIKETNSINDVVELIEETFKQDGILLSVEEAAQAVEEHLAEEALKWTKIKKIQDRLKPATPEPAKQGAGQETSKQQPIKTLTNELSSSQKLSRRERAMLAFEGKLNK